MPRRLLEDIVRYMDADKEHAVEVAGNGHWSRSMVRLLKDEIARYPGALAVGDFAARRAGGPEPVSLEEIVRETGMTKKQISSDLGAMSKAARRLFGEPRWPFRALDTAIGMTYLMPREIAGWWQETVDFWSEPSIDQLARAQGVVSPSDAASLRAEIWESEEDLDEFLADVYAARVVR